jgi:hypothetical protein
MLPRTASAREDARGIGAPPRRVSDRLPEGADPQLKLVEGKDTTTGQQADQGRQLGLLGSTETMTIVG